MATDRIDIFSQTDARDLSRFAPKSRAGEGQPTAADIAAQLPEEGKFVSREVPRRTKPVRALSDRQMQFNSRVSEQTRQGFEALSLRLNLPRGEVLARALRALEREWGKGSHDPSSHRPPPAEPLQPSLPPTIIASCCSTFWSFVEPDGAMELP